MVDVAMFAANLWFAGQKKNWPLANYYLGEMRNRMRWEVHLNPGAETGRRHTRGYAINFRWH